MTAGQGRSRGAQHPGRLTAAPPANRPRCTAASAACGKERAAHTSQRIPPRQRGPRTCPLRPKRHPPVTGRVTDVLPYIQHLPKESYEENSNCQPTPAVTGTGLRTSHRPPHTHTPCSFLKPPAPPADDLVSGNGKRGKSPEATGREGGHHQRRGGLPRGCHLVPPPSPPPPNPLPGFTAKTWVSSPPLLLPLRPPPAF